MDFSRAHIEKPNNIWKFWMLVPPIATSNSASTPARSWVATDNYFYDQLMNALVFKIFANDDKILSIAVCVPVFFFSGLPIFQFFLAKLKMFPLLSQKIKRK